MITLTRKEHYMHDTLCSHLSEYSYSQKNYRFYLIVVERVLTVKIMVFFLLYEFVKHWEHNINPSSLWLYILPMSTLNKCVVLTLVLYNLLYTHMTLLNLINTFHSRLDFHMHEFWGSSLNIFRINLNVKENYIIFEDLVLKKQKPIKLKFSKMRLWGCLVLIYSLFSL